jgi:hypothetical protein
MPRVTPGPVEWGTRVAGGPVGATAYSADSPDLFPPLPEPEERRPPAPARAADGWRARPDSRYGAYGGPGAHGGAQGTQGAQGAPPPFAWPDSPDPAARASDAGEPGPGRANGESPWPQGTGPGHPGQGPWPPRGRGTAAATTALVLGVASLLLLPVCGIGVLVALAGLVVGVVALTRGVARGRALAGLALSVLALLIAVSFTAWLASTGVARCLDETLYPTRGDLEACLQERLGVPLMVG